MRNGRCGAWLKCHVARPKSHHAVFIVIIGIFQEHAAIHANINKPNNPPIHNLFTCRFIDLTGATPDFPGGIPLQSMPGHPCGHRPLVGETRSLYYDTRRPRVDETRYLRV